MTLFHLYAAYAIVPTQELRYIHVAFTLVLSFLLFPLAMRFRNRVRWWDIVPGMLAVAAIGYALWGGDDFTDRAAVPERWDVVVGIVFIVLLLEATRRTTGAIMPVVSILFIAYAMLGPYLPAPWTHRGYDIARLVGHLFITLEGIFGVAVDVSATLIILFTIYGAFLHQSGAGKFFIDFSLALMGGKPNSAGRTVVLSSFLLGGPSGSGVATTVMIGTVAYPMLEKAGFEKNAAGGLLAAGGLGAILSPPVLGAAAFLIAEFLKISYLDVIWMAVIPTCLYYLSLLIMVELDAKRFGASNVSFAPELTLGKMTLRYGFHFVSLLAVVVFMLFGYSASLSVFYATLCTFLLSFIRARHRADAEEARARDGRRLDRRAECGDHLRLRRHRRRRRHADRARPEILLDRHRLCRRQPAADRDLHGADRLDHRPRRAGDRLLHHLRGDRGARADETRRAGFRRAHVHLLLCGAVGSVAADRAVAVRGRRHHRRRSLQTTLQSWKYTLPAFLVPFVFVLDPQGIGLLMKIPKDGSWIDIIEITIKTTLGLMALAAAAQNWALRKNTALESALLVLAGLLLVFPSLIEAIVEAIIGRDISYTFVPGLIIGLGVLLWQARTMAPKQPVPT